MDFFLQFDFQTDENWLLFVFRESEKIFAQVQKRHCEISISTFRSSRGSSSNLLIDYFVATLLISGLLKLPRACFDYENGKKKLNRNKKLLDGQQPRRVASFHLNFFIHPKAMATKKREKRKESQKCLISIFTVIFCMKFIQKICKLIFGWVVARSVEVDGKLFWKKISIINSRKKNWRKLLKFEKLLNNFIIFE